MLPAFLSGITFTGCLQQVSKKHICRHPNRNRKLDEQWLNRYYRAQPRRKIQMCQPDSGNESSSHGLDDGSSSKSPVRDMTLLALPMTSGNDILFPGCSQLLSLDGPTAERLLREVSQNEPPDFAYIPLNAWGDPGTAGTIAIIDDLQYSPSQQSASLLCTGVCRFKVIHLDESLSQARVEEFHDDDPKESQVEELSVLEERLVTAMTQVVTLSIKISDDKDEARQRALTETLRRVEAFCGKEDGRQLLHHWILELSPTLRRELLGFIVIDLLSVSFMDRRTLLMSTNTAERLEEALKGLEPFVRELAAKGAIVGALGRGDSPDEPLDPPSTE